MSERSFPSPALDELVRVDKPICYGVLKPGVEDPHGVPLVRIVDMDSAGLRRDGLFRITPALDKEFGRSRIATGDLLLSIQGTVGRVAIVPPEVAGANISRTIARLAFASAGDSRFYKHWFLSTDGLRAIEGAIVGTTRSSLNIGVLRKVRVPSPLDPEKVKIVEVLDAFDATIRQTEAIIEKLKQVKQGLQYDLLTRGIDANGELRPPQSQAPHLYKDSPLGWIPKEWRLGPIDSFLDRIIDYRGKTPTKAPAGVPLITAKNVRLGYVDPEPREFIGLDEFDRWMTRGIPRRGDILFTTEAPLGNVAQIDTDEQLAFAQRMIILQANETTFGTFLKYLMLGQQFRQRLFSMGSGSTVEGVQQSTFRRLAIAVPESVAEQREIVQRLASADLRVDRELALLGKWREVKAGLMDDLLTGRVRVTPLLT